MTHLDATHDPALKSWVESANEPGCDFPIQNLPLCVFRWPNGDEPAIGVAIGDQVLELRACASEALSGLDNSVRAALTAPDLNHLMSLGTGASRTLREALSHLLSVENPALRDDEALRARALGPIEDAEFFVPAAIGDYTDFYCSIEHATNVGSMFRPDNPLLPNYRHIPIGYHGRASSIVISGTPVHRPMGQTRPSDDAPPLFGPCRLLDYELEMGFFVGRGNEMGQRVPMGHAADHIFGLSIVNDWSARDVQKWEYQPLGPFNAKNFATSVSPWVVMLDALAPFRRPGPPRGADDPAILDYLTPVDDMALDVTVEVRLSSSAMRERAMESMLVSRGNMKSLYWTIAQMLAHHTSTGCNLNPGDLIATGTISGRQEESRGCLLERTWRGQNPLSLPDGTERKFLQNGDEVIISAFCEADGAARIGFGECRGVVLPVRKD